MRETLVGHWRLRVDRSTKIPARVPLTSRVNCSSATSQRRSLSGVPAMLVVAVAWSPSPPDPDATCIRQRRLPVTAGDRDGVPEALALVVFRASPSWSAERDVCPRAYTSAHRDRRTTRNAQMAVYIVAGPPS